MRLLQINLNHHWAAQNLLAQNMVEHSFDLACVSEPASVPRSSHWFASTNGLAPIVTRSGDPSIKDVLMKAGRNFVALKCGNFCIFSVYIASSESDINFHLTLDDLGAVVRTAGGRCIVTGDFNAKSILWGGLGHRLARLCAREMGDWPGPKAY